jgi:hypothetical protein
MGRPRRRRMTWSSMELRGSWYVSRSPRNRQRPKRCSRTPSRVGSETPSDTPSSVRMARPGSRPGWACAEISMAARSSGTSEPATTWAKRAVTSTPATVPAVSVRPTGPNYPPVHVPRRLRDQQPRQARRDHGAGRPGDHLRRARRRGQPPLAPLPRRRPATGRPHGAVPGEPPEVPVDHVGRPLRRPLLHRHQLPAHHRGDGLHPRRLRRKVFITSTYKVVEQAAELADQMPGVKVRLMRRRRGRRLRALRGGPGRPSPTSPQGRMEGTDMLYSSAPPASPRASRSPCRTQPLGTPDPVTMLAQLLFGLSEDAVYLSPAPLYHAAPLRFCMGVHRIGGTVIVMEHFDPEEFLAPRRAPPGDPHPGGAHHVRAHAEAAPRRCAPATTCPASRSRCTPPRPARSP